MTSRSPSTTGHGQLVLHTKQRFQTKKDVEGKHISRGRGPPSPVITSRSLLGSVISQVCAECVKKLASPRMYLCPQQASSQTRSTFMCTTTFSRMSNYVISFGIQVLLFDWVQRQQHGNTFLLLWCVLKRGGSGAA